MSIFMLESPGGTVGDSTYQVAASDRFCFDFSCDFLPAIEASQISAVPGHLLSGLSRRRCPQIIPSKPLTRHRIASLSPSAPGRDWLPVSHGPSGPPDSPPAPYDAPTRSGDLERRWGAPAVAGTEMTGDL